MHINYDVFHGFKVITAWDNTQFTASNTGLLVLDRRDYGPNVRACLHIKLNLVPTATAANYFDFQIHEAAEKTSTVALTSGAVAAAGSIYPWSNEGVLDENSLTWPRVNATGMASDVLWTQYKGTANCIQVQPTETGTADITCAGTWFLFNGHTQNLPA